MGCGHKKAMNHLMDHRMENEDHQHPQDGMRNNQADDNDPLNIVKKRLANGEISVEEYHQIKKML